MQPEEKNNQGKVYNVFDKKTIQKDSQLASVLIPFTQMYSSELDLTSKKSFALVAKNFKNDLIKSVNEFSFDKITKDARKKTFFELAVGVENLKTSRFNSIIYVSLLEIVTINDKCPRAIANQIIMVENIF